MDKTLQDLAWSCLPKEFKEEVKKEFRKGYVCETLTMLITLFGHHNLTSDAEGEEMLTVKRSDVINEFDKLHKLSYKAADLQLGLNAFRTLFGSKCLPDEEPKPAEPKEDKHFDNILKDSFRDHNRLHIAAMAMQGILANSNNNANLSETVVDALNCADALIAEVEKGNSDGED